jgi:general secretion pathway protein E/type IV pilus assembly protein PilB
VARVAVPLAAEEPPRGVPPTAKTVLDARPDRREATVAAGAPAAPARPADEKPVPAATPAPEAKPAAAAPGAFAGAAPVPLPLVPVGPEQLAQLGNVPALVPMSPDQLPELAPVDTSLPKFAELAQFEVDSEAVKLLPRDFCEQNKCVILGSIPLDANASIAVGMIDPENEMLLMELVGMVGRRLHPVQLNDYEVKLAINRGFGTEKTTGMRLAIQLDYARKIGFDPEQQPSEMLDDLLSVAIQLGASDIHIETYSKDVDLRFRKGGVMRQIPTPISPDNVKKVISRIKVLCNLDIAAKPQPMDGRFSCRYASEEGKVRKVDFRVSIAPTPRGEECVIRVMDASVTRRTLDELGMAPSSLSKLKTLLRCPSGLLLVTGPTGSGKTTTLYGCLREMHGEELKVCTVEDPIEYEVPKVNQFQVTEDHGFADFAKALLRQDPDVIMIGEIRDPDTANVAVRAASTGHLVLSTVHTDDAVAAITRLRMLGIDDEILSATLLGSTAQRIVRRICEGCKAKHKPPPSTIARFFKDPPDYPFWRGKGCKACHGSGFHGSFAVFEVFTCDDAIATAIGKHETLVEIRQRAKADGFVPIVEQALERVKEGATTIEEVERTIRPIYYV